VLLLGFIMSCLVMRPLARLSMLMSRLRQLDFARDSSEYEKLQKGRRGRLREINELQDGFCSLSNSIEVFARFVPDTVVRNLVKGDKRASRLHVSRRNVTIMFSDIRDFTSISEGLKQEQLVLLLTMYLTVMTQVIQSFEGVVGEILGDGILAFWNTPDDVEDHAAKACAAALSQQQALGPLNTKLKKERLPQLSIRIGVHTGEVLTGNIGSESKMKFGCMGDPVNLASRLEGLCKIYGVGIICSGATKALFPAEEGFVCRKLDLVQVKGKKEPTTIYEVIGRDLHRCHVEVTDQSPGTGTTSRPMLLARTKSGQFSPSRINTGDWFEWKPVPPRRIAKAHLYEEALEAYSQQQFGEAARLVGKLLEEDPDDMASRRLFQRSSGLAQAGGKELDLASKEDAWSPVVSMDEK